MPQENAPPQTRSIGQTNCHFPLTAAKQQDSKSPHNAVNGRHCVKTPGTVSAQRNYSGYADSNPGLEVILRCSTCDKNKVCLTNCKEDEIRFLLETCGIS